MKALHEGRYGNAVRREYAETLDYYVDDLPTAPGVGNILLAYDSARVLHAMFVADADMLPEGFASRLRAVIANQFALNGFYPLVQRHDEAVNTANWSHPFPFESAKAFFRVVDENTPQFFEPEVGHGLHRVEQSAPPVELATGETRASSAAIQPPPLPAGVPSAEHSRLRQLATAANTLWSVFLKGKDLPGVLDGWTQTAHKLGENIGPILEFLRSLGPPN